MISPLSVSMTSPYRNKWHPSLTTVHQPLQQMGRSAVNMLMAMISGLDVPFNQITLPTELIIRQSTSKPKAKA